jgi:hypothetical protein
LQVDIPEPLLLALTLACESLSISKSKFLQKAIFVALQQYCNKNPEQASKSLQDLLRESEAHLLD